MMFEATQARPVYWDKAPVHRQHLSTRKGDWRMAQQRLTREFETVDAAIGYARRLLGQRPGCPVKIRQSHALVAVVSRDALGRTWTDAQTMDGLL